MTAALSVRGLSHAFGARKALEDVSVEVTERSFTVLLGPNGAGKTTLVSLITGLYHPQAGTITVHGHDVVRERARALAALGVVFQMPTLDADLTLAENLRYQAGLHGLSRREGELRMLRQLEVLGLAERAGERVRALSGGLRRRGEIARALLHGPRLLVCDEPSVGLDVEARRGILAHVRRLCSSEGLSVLWATHLLDEVEPGDPILVLHKGRVRWRGRSGDLAGPAGQPGLAEQFLALTAAG